VHELEEQYDNVGGTVQIIILTQWLETMQQARALKEQVDATRQKETLFKVRIQPWIDEAFTITVDIEGKLA